MLSAFISCPTSAVLAFLISINRRLSTFASTTKRMERPCLAKRYIFLCDRLSDLTNYSKQGISLSVEQYNAFLKAVPRINAALRAKGLVVEGGDDEELEAALEAAPKAKKGGKKSPKANIDTTSEEEN